MVYITFLSHFLIAHVLICHPFTIGGAWGLNFMSESEALKFLEECSVSTTHTVCVLKARAHPYMNGM